MASGFGSFPASLIPELANEQNDFAVQMRNIARSMLVGRSLGMRRQVFNVTFGNWDTHSNQAATLNEKFTSMAEGLRGFWSFLVRTGLANSVTTFTMSDFGRALASNGDGSDHGWGSTHLVFGGGIAGGKHYGTPPQVGLDTQDTTASGRLIPTTSIDQLAADLAIWMGIAPSGLLQVTPHLANFDPSSRQLGLYHA